MVSRAPLLASVGQARSPVCGGIWLKCGKACCRLLTCEVLDAAYHAIADLWAFAAKDERSKILRWIFGSGQYARQAPAAFAAIEHGCTIRQ
jgi:hypothetical protein